MKYLNRVLLSFLVLGFFACNEEIYTKQNTDLLTLDSLDNSEILRNDQITIDNIGELHNQLVIQYIQQETFDNPVRNVPLYFAKILESSDIDIDGFDNLYNIHSTVILEDIWLPNDIGLNKVDLRYIDEVIRIVNSGFNVSETQNLLDDVISNIIKSELSIEKQKVIISSIRIGQSSYELWAPKELGGLGLEQALRLKIKSENRNLKDWGEWFAKTATADIIGGLAGAGRAAFVAAAATAATGGAAAPAAAGGVLGAGLFGAAVSSVTTGIMASK